MPALDFPSSPTNGQVFGQYTYDSTKGAWRVTNGTAMSVIPSPTPPTSPVAGNLWLNTNDGVLFYYYNDGNSSQWVEAKSNTASGSTVAARVDALEAKPSGLVQLTPSSIAVSSGSASVTNGLITFSGVTTISMNDIFSGSYANYQFNLVITQSSVANADINGRLRVSGSDLAASYYVGGVFQEGGTLQAINNLNIGHWQLGRTHSATDPNSHSALNFKVFQPFPARPSTFFTESTSWTNSAMSSFRFSGFNTALTSYTGFSLFANTGTFSGTLQVYGYR